MHRAISERDHHVGAIVALRRGWHGEYPRCQTKLDTVLAVPRDDLGDGELIDLPNIEERLRRIAPPDAEAA